MMDYVVVPLGEIINKGYDKEKIESAFKKFSCQREIDLEDFLVHKAITYEKADVGKTYLCIDKEALENGEFVVMAYFTLAQTVLLIYRIYQARRDGKFLEIIRDEIVSSLCLHI